MSRKPPPDGTLIIDPTYSDGDIDNDGNLYVRGHVDLATCAQAWEDEVGEDEGWCHGPVEHRWGAWRIVGRADDGRVLVGLDDRRVRFPRSFPVTRAQAGRIE